VAMIMKGIQSITRQRSTTSRHEVVRHVWLGWHLEENHNQWRKWSSGFRSTAGAGRKPIYARERSICSGECLSAVEFRRACFDGENDNLDNILNASSALIFIR